MEEFEEEVGKLSLILNDLDADSLLERLNKHAKEDCSVRPLLVLEDYFREKDLKIPEDVLNKEVTLIKQFFPECNEEYVMNLLVAIGNDNNRLKIITRHLINQKSDGVFECALCENKLNQPTKKVKREEPVYLNNNQTPSLESNSTIIYIPEEMDYDNVVEVLENPMDNDFYLAQPSTSTAHVEINNPSQFTHSFSPSFNSEEEKKSELVQIVGEFEMLEQSATIKIEPDYFNINTKDDVIVINENEVQQHEEFDEETENTTLVYPLMEMFPEACPEFIRKICKGKKQEDALHELISVMLETDYPKRAKCNSPANVLDASEQLEIMKNILVDADPDYLQMQCDMLIDKPDQMKAFIDRAIVERGYPTYKDFLRRQQLSAQQKQYSSEFTVENFLEVIPNPFEYFQDPNRKMGTLNYRSIHYALCYLRNKFDCLPLRIIRDSFSKTQQNFLESCTLLDEIPPTSRMRSKRKKCPMPEVIENIPLLQEIAFYEHKNEILLYIKEKQIREDIERAQTKQAGLMVTCSCCFDDEVMPKDVFCCDKGCMFCKSCVAKGIEVAFGEGKLDYSCLSDCSSYFNLQVLQAVLTPKMFSAVAVKKQVQEVKAAGIEDLETCPFCDFATIPAREDKLFRCLNPECMKESCRQCKEPSHVPLRCDEVEKDQDVKARTYIENKMTEALLRTCYKCGMKFVKEDGCNKMTCTCGALMCYVCGQPVKDYKHFNGLGGDKTELCPLYCDINVLHRDAVLKSAEVAKTEIGVTDNQLKINPVSDINDHYKSKSNQRINNIHPMLGIPQPRPDWQQRIYRYYQVQRQHRQRRRRRRYPYEEIP